MSSATAYDMLVGHLKSHWSSTRIYEENEASDPPAGDPWLYVDAESNEDQQESIGNGSIDGSLWREYGRLTIWLLVPEGGGGFQGRQLRDQLSDLFKQPFGPLVITGQSRSRGEAWLAGDGNWYGFPLHINWYMDH